MEEKIQNSEKEGTLKSTPKKLEESQPKSEIRLKTEEKEAKIIQEESKNIQKIAELSSDLFEAASAITKQAEANELKESIDELKLAINTLKTASALSMQTVSQPSRPVVNPKKDDCGCGCGEPHVKKCCVGLYITGLRVIKASDGPVQVLELITAVRAGGPGGGIKAVYPGLTSEINVHQKVGWVRFEALIAKICVPCGQEMSIPLDIEVMDVDKIASIPEKGSTQGSISINCNCKICSEVFTVFLRAGSIHPGEKKGEVDVEIAAKRIEGECCC